MFKHKMKGIFDKYCSKECPLIDTRNHGYGLQKPKKKQTDLPLYTMLPLPLLQQRSAFRRGTRYIPI
jgi:hypothetical protein